MGTPFLNPEEGGSGRPYITTGGLFLRGPQPLHIPEMAISHGKKHLPLLGSVVGMWNGEGLLLPIMEPLISPQPLATDPDTPGPSSLTTDRNLISETTSMEGSSTTGPGPTADMITPHATPAPQAAAPANPVTITDMPPTTNKPATTSFPYTLEPFVIPTTKKLRTLSRAHRLSLISCQRPLPTYTSPTFCRYYEICFPPNVFVRTGINIIRAQIELKNIVGALPTRPFQLPNPTEFNRSSYLIRVGTQTQGDLLTSITHLAGHRVRVIPSSVFNSSQGLVISDALTYSTLDEIKRDLSDQGITKVDRLSNRDKWQSCTLQKICADI